MLSIQEIIKAAVEQAVADALKGIVQGTATASEPMTATAPKERVAVRYFTDAEVAAGGGYPCQHPTKPCLARLRGPNRTRKHGGNGKDWHKAVIA
jgi:hypothetical protein